MIKFIKKIIYKSLQNIVIKVLPNRSRFIVPEIYKSYIGDCYWKYQKNGSIENFFKASVTKYLPYILKTKNLYSNNNEIVKILDFGCGPGQLAAAVKMYKDSSGKKINYTGIEIISDYINFLSNKFKNDKDFSFYLLDVKDNVNYQEQLIKNKTTLKESDGSEGNFKKLTSDKFNIQWSSSVFTHLTPAASKEALKSISALSEKNCIQINTWIIIDSYSKLSLLTDQCDRRLPYDNGDYLTYEKKNPLVEVAHKIEKIKEYYANANLEIIDIQRGHWRGGIYSNHIHYQDIIISRPIL